MIKGYDVKNLKLAKEGKRRIEWVIQHMPVLDIIKKKFSKNKPLKSVKVACCLHVTTETANLILTLKAGGAQVALCASNPLSTQDDVATSLAKDYGIAVFAKRGENKQEYYSHIKKLLAGKPHITMDDGADLVSSLHKSAKTSRISVIGGTEETTTGVIRLRSLEKDGKLRYPIIAVNDAYTKHLFDNRFGTGQSTIDAIMRATDILIAGTTFVVCGYGWCGRGVALRARGMGANVIISEVDPVRALEAVMDGFRVMSLSQASKIGDIFVTLTGNISIIRKEHFCNMKDGAMLANSGHFNVEIDIPALKKMSTKTKQVREDVTEYRIGKKRVYLLGEGRLINLVAATGHPASVMDMSFANQALCCEYIYRKHEKIGNRVLSVPSEIDSRVAKLKLKSMGINIDKLSGKQKHYLDSWSIGT